MTAKQISFSDLPNGLTERGKHLAIMCAVDRGLNVDYGSIFNTVRYFKQNDMPFAVSLAEDAERKGFGDTNTLYGGPLPMVDGISYTEELLNRAHLAREVAEKFEEEGFVEKANNTYSKAILFYEWVGGFCLAAELAEKVGDSRIGTYRSLSELFDSARNKK